MQYNCGNGSTMTRKEVSVDSETMEKRYRTCVTFTQRKVIEVLLGVQL